MKTKSLALAAQRQHVMRGERENERETADAELFFLVFCCSFNVLVHFLLLRICASGVTPLLDDHSKTSATSEYLHIVLISVYSRLYLDTTLSQLTFKPEPSSNLCLVVEGGHILFLWFNACADFGLTGFF